MRPVPRLEAAGRPVLGAQSLPACDLVLAPDSTDWFYPDFVCQLEDGRILAVEYKGGHLLDAPDAQEKRDIGTLWAARSNGRCLFAMPSDSRFDELLELNA